MEPVGEGAVRVTTAGIGTSDEGRDEAGANAGRPLNTLFRRAPSVSDVIDLARREAIAQLDRWFLWAPVGFGAGCGAYFALQVEPPLWLGAVLAAVALAGVVAARMKVVGRPFLIACNLVAFTACGFLAAELRTAWIGAPVLWDRGEVQGWVVDVAGPGSGGGRLLVAPYFIDGVAPGKLPARVRVTVGPAGLIGPGAAIRMRAILGPPPEPASPGAYDFARDAFFQRVGGVGFSLSEPSIVDGPRPPWALALAMRVNTIRWSLARRMIDDMGVKTGGVAVAMTTGHEAWLDPKEVQAMRDAGLSHILSISGVHMAIVGGFVFYVVRILIAAWPWAALRAPGKKIAAGAALAAIAVYLIISGAPPPAMRSAITLSVAFVAVLADRRAITLHALAVAALIVLALEPDAVVQPGFQMSFTATAALIALAEIWPRPIREINTPWPIRMVQGAGTWLLAGIAASFVAGSATGPFAIQHFNRAAVYGLPANLLMEPISSFLIMPALAAGAVLEAFGAGGWLLHVAGWGIALLDRLATMIAALPKAVVTVPSAPDIALPISFLGLLWICLWKGRLRWLGLPAALAVSLWPRPAAPVAWIASDGGPAAVVDHGSAVFLRPGSKAFASDLWARRRGLLQPADPAAAVAGRFDCDRSRCLPLSQTAPRLAAWWTRRSPPAEDVNALCSSADIVIFRRDAAPEGCAATAVLTGTDFTRGGSVEVYRAAGGWSFTWANDVRGSRPWTRTAAASPADQ